MKKWVYVAYHLAFFVHLAFAIMMVGQNNFDALFMTAYSLGWCVLSFIDAK